MKLILGALLWFFLASAAVLAIIYSFHWVHTTASVKLSLATLPGLNTLNKPSVLGVEKEDARRPTDRAQDQAEASADLEAGDARPQLVARFLERYNSPMTPHDEYGHFFVDLADKYGFDFRLLPAISMQESGLCKTIPDNTYNCLGLGITERSTWAFTSYKENFEAAAKILKKNYIDKGLTTPEQIMRKYTPGSNGSWANSVNQWMAEMRYNDRALGREKKTNASVLEFANPSAAPAGNE